MQEDIVLGLNFKPAEDVLELFQNKDDDCNIGVIIDKVSKVIFLILMEKTLRDNLIK